jgi:hypothetical protein
MEIFYDCSNVNTEQVSGMLIEEGCADNSDPHQHSRDWQAGGLR